MARRRSAPPKARPADWVITPNYLDKEFQTELTFRDWSGIMRRARLIEHVVTPKYEWITCVEVTSRGEVKSGYRSIHPDMVRKWWKRRKVQPTPKEKRLIKRGS